MEGEEKKFLKNDLKNVLPFRVIPDFVQGEVQRFRGTCPQKMPNPLKNKKVWVSLRLDSRKQHIISYWLCIK